MYYLIALIVVVAAALIVRKSMTHLDDFLYEDSRVQTSLRLVKDYSVGDGWNRPQNLVPVTLVPEVEQAMSREAKYHGWGMTR